MSILLWHRQTGRQFVARRTFPLFSEVKELIPIFEGCELYTDEDGEEHTTIHRGRFDEIVPQEMPPQGELVVLGTAYPEACGGEG